MKLYYLTMSKNPQKLWKISEQKETIMINFVSTKQESNTYGSRAWIYS